MQFRFVQAGTAAAERRADLEQRFVQFWSAFAARSPEVMRMLRERGPVADLMHDHFPFNELENGVEWEFGPSPDGQFELAITATPSQPTRAACERCIELAPSISGFHFTAWRPPVPPPMAMQLLAGRRGQLPPDAHYRIVVTGSQQLGFECLVHSERELTELENISGLLLAEVLLGEELVERWIGPFSTRAIPPHEAFPSDAVPFARLLDRVREHVAMLAARRPTMPRFNMTTDGWRAWHIANGIDVPAEARRQPVWNAKPGPGAPDAEGGDFSGQRDAIFFSIFDLPLYQALNRDSGTIDSQCFSAIAGERFAYVKIDRAGWENAATRRDDLEDAIDAALRGSGIGCTLSGGSGLRYGYVELAVTDIDRAIAIVHDVATPYISDGRRAWLLFHDRCWRDEWIDLGGKNRPPPRRTPVKNK